MVGIDAILGLLPCGVVVFGLAALIALVDVRTGRGYVLVTLSSLHLATTILVIGTAAIAYLEQPKPISRQNPSDLFWAFLYFIPAVYGTLVIMIGAAIVAGIARRWLWIVGFVAAAVIPFLVGALPYSLGGMNIDEQVVRDSGFFFVLVAPMATVLAYGITRIAHPVRRVSTRQLTPLT